MATLEAAKTAEDLRREIDELHRQQREINERLRDPKGLRRNALGGKARNIDADGSHQRKNAPRGVIRRGDGFDGYEQRPGKRRLLSAVVKVVQEEKLPETDNEIEENKKTQPDKDDADEETDLADRRPTLQRNYNADHSNPLPAVDSQRRGNSDSNTRTSTTGGHRSGGPGGPRRFPKERGFLVRVSNPHNDDAQPAEPAPRVLSKTSDPNVAKRNRRMFGALLGTLEKFRREDEKLSGSESFQRRSEQLKKAEHKAQEENERLRQQEKEALAEKRRADLILRAKLATEAEAKQLELLFLQWAEHHTRLASFIKTKAGPRIYYLPVKSSEETDKLLQEAQQDLEEWKARSREELSECQKRISELSMENLDADFERWKDGPPGRTEVSNNKLAAEANTGVESGDNIPEQPGEGDEIVEDKHDDTGAILVDEHERVKIEDAGTNKLVNV
ncbi:uncharacterized protein [Physcomitrium patens]|uniref:Pinin/SDK/MemA protein domain-containing protein n=1 Tax=Physcomitrium patens TaxID=3218 RepID=A0A2K1J3R1_PHYPA|nr:pinin-like isoform X2 [Physcomitrium patens]PNR36163.1 hypothetical protein PHYPA_022014 [Physcomitrium patens]|eukprot:XP_024401629.1 pinin-like isoform X2 [Physcomitrella patens]